MAPETSTISPERSARAATALPRSSRLAKRSTDCPFSKLTLEAQTESAGSALSGPRRVWRVGIRFSRTGSASPLRSTFELSG